MEDAIKVLFDARSSSYNNGAGAAVILYDILMVFPQEVTHIWSSRWSTAKVLYLLVRYWGAFLVLLNFIVYSQFQHSLRFCQIYFVLTTAGGPSAIIVVVHIITVMRLYALYDRSKLFLIVIGGFTSVVIAADMVLCSLMAWHAWKTTFLAPSYLPLQGCLCEFPPMSYVMASWAITLFLSCLLFGMMCIKFRTSTLKRHHCGVRNMSPVLTRLVQGGTIWFFSITATLLICLVFNQTVHGPLQYAFLPWMLIALSLSGSRLILNLREAAKKPETPSSLLDNIFFRQPTEIPPEDLLSTRTDLS